MLVKDLHADWLQQAGWRGSRKSMRDGKGRERNISAEYAQILCLYFCTHCLRLTVS